MPIRVHCPACGHAFGVPEKFAGRKGKCSKCGNVFQAPTLKQFQAAQASQSRASQSRASDSSAGNKREGQVVSSKGGAPTMPVPKMLESIKAAQSAKAQKEKSARHKTGAPAGESTPTPPTNNRASAPPEKAPANAEPVAEETLANLPDMDDLLDEIESASPAAPAAASSRLESTEGRSTEHRELTAVQTPVQRRSSSKSTVAVVGMVGLICVAAVVVFGAVAYMLATSEDRLADGGTGATDGRVGGEPNGVPAPPPGGAPASPENLRTTLTDEQFTAAKTGIGRLEVFSDQGKEVGGAFLIDPRGWFATNYDLLVGGTSATLLTASGRKFVEGVIASDPDANLAIVKLESPPGDELKVLPVANSQTPAGSTVYACSSQSEQFSDEAICGVERLHLTGDLPPTSRQYMSRRLRESPDIQWIKYGAKVDRYSRGAPLLNGAGEVVGVHQYLGRSAKSGHAVAANHLANLIEQAGDGDTVSSFPPDVLAGTGAADPTDHGDGNGEDSSGGGLAAAVAPNPDANDPDANDPNEAVLGVSLNSLQQIADACSEFGFCAETAAQYAKLDELARRITVARQIEDGEAGTFGGAHRQRFGAAAQAVIERIVQSGLSEMAVSNQFALESLKSDAPAAFLTASFFNISGHQAKLDNRRVAILRIEGTQGLIALPVELQADQFTPGSRFLILGMHNANFIFTMRLDGSGDHRAYLVEGKSVVKMPQ